MSTKKKFGAEGVLSAFQGSTALQNRAPRGLQYSEVQYVHPNQLSVNLLNESLFPEEDGDRLDKLSEDIGERGITTPLIAKKDGTLLAGHNRLRIARQLNLSVIPVRYLETEISEHEELLYVIKDNLLRRQFKQEDYERLYERMYPNFRERMEKRHGLNPATRVERFHPSEAPITAPMIARDTGQKVATVQKQLQKMDNRSKKESAKNRRSQDEIAVLYTPSQITAKKRELGKIVTKSSERILEKVGLYNFVLADEDRANIAAALRYLADQIENMQTSLPS